MIVKNLFTEIPAQLPVEVFQTLVQNPHLTLERIISKGHITEAGKWYNQDFEEWVILLEGQARLQFAKDNSIITLTAGDYLLIPAPHLMKPIIPPFESTL